MDSPRAVLALKGELSWILNVGITRDRAARTLTMSQSLYVTDLISKFGSFIDASLTRRVDCPMEEGTLLNSDDQPVVDSAEHADFSVQREAYMSLTGGRRVPVARQHDHVPLGVPGQPACSLPH